LNAAKEEAILKLDRAAFKENCFHDEEYFAGDDLTEFASEGGPLEGEEQPAEPAESKELSMEEWVEFLTNE
jgi:hypothetical protein